MLINLEAGLELLRQDYSFYSSLLSKIELRESKQVPLCGVMFDTSSNRYVLAINEDTFKYLSINNVCGVLIHELLHIVHNHNFRFNNTLDKDLANICMDLSINQYINGRLLPDFSLRLSDVKKQLKIELESFQTWEYYYDKLQSNSEQLKQKYTVSHTILDGTETDLEEERKVIIKRTITEKNYSDIPACIEDEFNNYETENNKVNYQNILKRIIRKSITKGQRRTYSRLNKKYGQQVKGYQDNKEARLCIYVDTSASMSPKEIGDEIEIIDNFCKITKTEILVSFFHTSIYKTQKFTNKEAVIFKKIESGGTVLYDVFKNIETNKADLSIIITDGYYDTRVKSVSKQVLFLITDKGNKEHTLKNLGQTLIIKKEI